MLEMAVSDVPAFCVVLVVKRCVVFVREVVLKVLFAVIENVAVVSNLYFEFIIPSIKW